MLVEVHRGIGPGEAEWEELADRCGADPWSRPGWFAAWHDAFGGGELEVVTMRRDGRLAALVPVEREGAVLRSPTNWHSPGFEPLAEDTEARDALLSTLLSAGSRRVELDFVSAETVDALRVLRPGTLASVRMRSPYVSLEAGGEAVVESRSRSFVKEQRRRRRRLGEQGELRFELLDGSERLDELLEEGFRVEASGWKTESGTAIRSAPETLRFYAEIARWLAGRSELGLGFLRLDGEAIAFELTVQAPRRVYLLKGGYDEAYRRFGPGQLLGEDLIRHAADRGAETYELLGSDESFKLDWTDTVRTRWRAQAFSRSLPGLVDRAAWAYGRPAAKRLLALRRS